MPVLLRFVKAPRLHDMKVFSRTRHRHVEQPTLLVDLLGCPLMAKRIKQCVEGGVEPHRIAIIAAAASITLRTNDETPAR